MDRTQQLKEKKILSLLLQFSIPAIMGMVVNSLYNLLDQIFVGRGVGSIAIAAVAVSHPMVLLLGAFNGLIAVGGTVLVSLRLGEEKKDEAQLVFGNTIMLLVIASIILTFLGLIFLEPSLKLFGASKAVLPYAKEYSYIILSGIIFQMLSIGMNGFIRGEGNPNLSFLIVFMGVVCNSILNPLFIFGFKLGIKGTALATIISQIATTIWVGKYFFSKKSFLKISLPNFRLKGNIIKKSLSIGLAPFLMQISTVIFLATLNNSLAKYGGDLAIAAMGVISSICMMIMMPIFGINQGIQPIIGYNYGAKQYQRVKEALKLSIIGATGIVAFGYIIIMIFTEELVRLFNNQDNFVKICSEAIRIFFMFLPVVGFQTISAGYFQAVGKPLLAMLLILARQNLVLIPAVWLLSHFFGLTGIYYAGPVTDLLVGIIAVVFLYFEIKRLNQKVVN